MFNAGLYPYAVYNTKNSLFTILKNIKYRNILSNTQKTLGVINQAIPIVYQAKPIWNNAKTMFQIIGAIKGDSSTTNKSNNNVSNISQYSSIQNANFSVHTKSQSNQPNFFL